MTLSSLVDTEERADQFSIVIKRDPLVCDRDDDLERAFRRASDRTLLADFRLWPVPVLVLVSEWSMMAPPRPVLGPKRKLSVCDPVGSMKTERASAIIVARMDPSVHTSGEKCRRGALTAPFRFPPAASLAYPAADSHRVPTGAISAV